MRYALAFAAGFVATLLFHQGLVALFHRAGYWARPAWSMTPTWPLQVPQVVSSAFWAGLWAVLLAALLQRWSQGASYWIAWLVAGAIAPTLVALFVVLPLKGRPMAGGWEVKLMIGGMMVNAVWGLGTALLLRLARRLV